MRHERGTSHLTSTSNARLGRSLICMTDAHPVYFHWVRPHVDMIADSPAPYASTNRSRFEGSRTASNRVTRLGVNPSQNGHGPQRYHLAWPPGQLQREGRQPVLVLREPIRQPTGVQVVRVDRVH